MADQTFTNKEKARAAQREVGQRRKVYANLVANRGMAQEKADYGIAIMQAIANDYDMLAIADDLRQGRLL